MNSNFQRIVHLDLKGAPWKVEYLTKVILVAKKWGATGILFEWEDTFPFYGDLTCVGSIGGSSGEGLYSHDEVQYLLQFVKDNDLIPIQLIQTIGHLEFVLKHERFSSLRELSGSPAVLCPTKTGSMPLVGALVTQILDAQPDASYIHIGADEAWHMNVCADCQAKSQIHEHGPAGLYLDHIATIAAAIKAKRPTITVLMWDDMLRNINKDTLKAYKLGDLVQPVVWNYSPMGAFSIDVGMWVRYKHVFHTLWAGSAFKGANGSCQMACSVNRYVSNQEAWLNEIQSCDASFTGVILTGWSRFDHYATLCELLPVSLPSLASCLKMWTKSRDTPKEVVVSELLVSEQWPGEELARCVNSFVILKERINMFLQSDQVQTWMNEWQLSHKYTSPLQMESIIAVATQLLAELGGIERSLAHGLCITGDRSRGEWVGTWVNPLVSQLTVHAHAQRRTAAPIAPT